MSDPDVVPATVAAALSVPVPPGLTPTQAISNWMTERPRLLIIDNAEQIIDAVATLTIDIASAAKSTTVVTSREPLGLPGEQVHRVASLDPATDGVALFVQRARSASHTFALDEANRAVIESICRRLDGIPLAVELAAARVGSLGVHEIEHRLNDRFRLLRSSGRGRTERHQTLHAAVAWSVSLLESTERIVFERLCVFAGRFTLADAEQIVADPEGDPVDAADLIDVLAALVDKSMVVADTTGGVATYRLLDTMRQWGEQTIPSAHASDLKHRHLAYFQAHARRLFEQTGTADEARATHGFELAWDNLRAAFEWALATESIPGAADLATTTTIHAIYRGRREHHSWCAAALTLAEHGRDAADDDWGRLFAATGSWIAVTGWPGAATAAFEQLLSGYLKLSGEAFEAATVSLATMGGTIGRVRDIPNLDEWPGSAHELLAHEHNRAWIAFHTVMGTISDVDLLWRDHLDGLIATLESPSARALALVTRHVHSELLPAGWAADPLTALTGLIRAEQFALSADNPFIAGLATGIRAFADSLAEEIDPAALMEELRPARQSGADRVIEGGLIAMASALARRGRSAELSLILGYDAGHPIPYRGSRVVLDEIASTATVDPVGFERG